MSEPVVKQDTISKDIDKMTIEEAIRHFKEVEIENRLLAAKFTRENSSDVAQEYRTHAAESEQLVEWLTELKEAKSIIRVCNKVLGFLLEHEIESMSTRHEVETLLKNITKYLSGGSENNGK